MGARPTPKPQSNNFRVWPNIRPQASQPLTRQLFFAWVRWGFRRNIHEFLSGPRRALSVSRWRNEFFQPHNMGAITAVRQGQQNRRGRGRHNGNNSGSGGGNHSQNTSPRKHQQNPLSRSFESNGPDVKVRGTPAHIAEKYLALARDAQTSGDPVLAENYFQHAEHYNRIIMAYREQLQQQGDPSADGSQRSPREGNEGDDAGGDDDGGGQMDQGNEPNGNVGSSGYQTQGPPQGQSPQGQFPQGQYNQRPPQQPRQDRGGDRGYEGQTRDDRQFRRDQNQNRFRNGPNGGQRNGGDRGYNNDRGGDRGYEPRSDQQRPDGQRVDAPRGDQQREPRFDSRDGPRDGQRDGARDGQRDGQRDGGQRDAQQRDGQREQRGGYRAERPDGRPDPRPEAGRPEHVRPDNRPDNRGDQRRENTGGDGSQSEYRPEPAELRQGLPTDRPPVVRTERPVRAERPPVIADAIATPSLGDSVPTVAAAPKRRERATPAHDQPDFLLRPVRRPRAKPEAASPEASVVPADDGSSKD
jgi:hypothetical protein